LDTKSKNYRYSAWFKLLAVIICVSGMITLAYGLLQAPYFEEAIQNKEFKESMASKNIFQQVYYHISVLAFNYKSEENIKAGSALNQAEIADRKSYLGSQKETELQQAESSYYESVNTYQGYLNNRQFTIDSDGNVSDGSDIISGLKNDDILEKIKQLKEKKDNSIKEINEKYDKLLGDVEKDAINQQLADYKAQLGNLENYPGIYYTVVQAGKNTLTNVAARSAENYYSTLPISVKLTQSNWGSFFGNYSYSSYLIPSDTTVYFGMSQERYQTEVSSFEKNVARGLTGVKTSSLGLLLVLISLSYLVYSSGRRPGTDGVQLITVDMIYLDIALAISIPAIALCIAPVAEFVPYFYRDNLRYNISLIYVIFSVIIAIGTLIGILFTTMFVKRLKRREIIRHTLIYKILRWFLGRLNKLAVGIRRNISGVFGKSPLVMRLILIFGGYSFIILIFTLILFASGGDMGALFGLAGIVGVNVVAVYFLLKNFKTFINIKDGTERIRAGELTYNIPEQGIPELRTLAGSINQIADGLKSAVGSQVKAERMKAELITNVSHDLKTPLTSIITYVDLLKNEGLESENAHKYLGIIDSKSQRLKSLTEDLFEAAKATSGNIAMNLERLNVASLVSQGLGELSDKIEASGLTFKTGFPAENAYVMADGKLLWRVMENLLSNVFKYALPGSRVYIDVNQVGDRINIVIKNISAYELNVTEDELMERFKRGDASRHSEGSGLGLSIAKSLTELQGGNFKISIDGDLFKAIIELPGCTE